VRYRKKYKMTTHSNHRQPVFANVLDRQFSATGPDQAYLSDITMSGPGTAGYPGGGGQSVLQNGSGLEQAASRRKAILVINALLMAIGQHRSKAGFIGHSNRGSQSARKAYGFIGSMSHRGDCWDNAVAESFLSLKKERMQWRNYQARFEAQKRYRGLPNDVLQKPQTTIVSGLGYPNGYESALN
jgi:putative transposase